VERNPKEGQNPPRVVAPVEEKVGEGEKEENDSQEFEREV
jgi:hypothetical protein